MAPITSLGGKSCFYDRFWKLKEQRKTSSRGHHFWAMALPSNVYGIRSPRGQSQPVTPVWSDPSWTPDLELSVCCSVGNVNPMAQALCRVQRLQGGLSGSSVSRAAPCNSAPGSQDGVSITLLFLTSPWSSSHIGDSKIPFTITHKRS